MTRRPSRCTPLIRFGPLMSSRAMRRMPAKASVLPPHGVTQLPLALLVFPQVRRAEGVREVVEVRPIDDRLLEHLRCRREFLRRDAQIAEDLLREALRELPVETTHQRHAFVAVDVGRTDLLRSVVGGAADAELDES